MRVAIIGAGIIGVTTAFELAADGHEVTVFERHAGVASETSFADAGVIAPGWVTPWAAPGMPLKVLSQLFSRHAPVRVGGLNALGHLPWMWRWWRACRPAVYRAHRGPMYQLARYSSQRLHELTHNLNLDYEQARGVLVLLRSARDLAHAQASLHMLSELQVPFELLDASQCHRLEPRLNADTPLKAAISLPQDGVGNCRQFAHLMRVQAQRHGARFLFQHQVLGLSSGPAPRVTARNLGDTGKGRGAKGGVESIEFDFDAVVVCAGHQANHLLEPLGLALPIMPLYGYSVTAPLRTDDAHAAAGPRGAVIDEGYEVVIARLGQRIRVSGSAELGGSTGSLSDAALATLYKVLDDWFPGTAQLSRAQRWKGARTMLPDGPPVLGQTRAAGIWLNLGHGSSGWALSCGTARLLADLLSRREPAIDIGGLAPQRLLG